MPYICKHCSAEFDHPSKLGSHNRHYNNGRCKKHSLAQTAARTPHAASLGEALRGLPDTNQVAAEQETLGAEELNLAQDYLGFEPVGEDSQDPGDSCNTAFEIFKLLSTWNNGVGTCAADTHELLNLIHNPHFRVNQVGDQGQMWHVPVLKCYCSCLQGHVQLVHVRYIQWA
jgi:hypothetical protein